ncbi:peptide chain release factor N(5)-glutamine methyltransferase [Salinicola rhizosphaerae]|uniref:Release factor glutamine methyltransferase n=1 Tax=Salinicola rhizosphaerae TaxID=1443141 RepID=A0ABQ3DR10_9GAMM|nr:peptide chain release factor N(5)-glutamine methyltransferase [Salinicola rhizosphaerae]GHB11025.1 release factor glutamine methyltransferase [Salinicola rhizosphaerae]
MTIDEALREATLRLDASSTARLDAEVLLAHVCQRDRTWLYTWGDRVLARDVAEAFEALVGRRVEGWPVAYLTGEREFWGLPIQTSPATLIPRPDTERLVEVALEASAGRATGALLDLGTGTGAVALAFASERSGWQVTGVDVAKDAVALATDNGRRLQIVNAAFLQSDWFAAVGERRFDLIVSNPPYIAAGDPHLALSDVRFEPESALVAADQGLHDIRRIVSVAPLHLSDGGELWIEHGYAQGASVRDMLTQRGFAGVASHRDLAGHERVSGGRWR